MPTKFLYKGISIDERTEEYIEKKLQAIRKMLQDIPESEIESDVEIDLDKKGKFRVEVMIKTPYQLYRGEDTTESVEGSVDLVENQLKTQIQRDKDKHQSLVRSGGREIKEGIVIDENARF